MTTTKSTYAVEVFDSFFLRYLISDIRQGFESLGIADEDWDFRGELPVIDHTGRTTSPPRYYLVFTNPEHATLFRLAYNIA